MHPDFFAQIADDHRAKREREAREASLAREARSAARAERRRKRRARAWSKGQSPNHDGRHLVV